MFNEIDGLGDFGESKESLLGRGCSKVSKGVFRCPDGSTVTPDSGFTAMPGGDIVRSVPDRCPPGQSWVGPPVNQCMQTSSTPSGGGPPIDVGGTVGKRVGAPDTGPSAGPESSGDIGSGINSFFSGSVAGIPIWMIAAGIGAVLLLKKR